MRNVDFVVIGGGIAGVSAAYHLSPYGAVVLVEGESQLAHHTTGRSAAIFTENYGGRINRLLTVASRDFLESNALGLSDSPLLERIGMLDVGGVENVDSLTQSAIGGGGLVPSLELLDEKAIRDLIPCIRPGVVAAGVWEPNASELDVMGLHQAFVRGARQSGAQIERDSKVSDLSRQHGIWTVHTEGGDWRAPVIVNAAGAWGDAVASLAGVAPVGLRPMRRTAFTVVTSFESSGWPFVSFENPEQECYFKPEAGGQLLCSPADETPSEPCDARPEEIDIARAIESINELTTLEIRSIRSSWAGLRTFAPDRNPVLGWAADTDGFCWMVGQGGTGIQTSPAAGALVASIVAQADLPFSISDMGLSISDLAPR